MITKIHFSEDCIQTNLCLYKHEFALISKDFYGSYTFSIHVQKWVNVSGKVFFEFFYTNI